jgi:hypothetical protein
MSMMSEIDAFIREQARQDRKNRVDWPYIAVIDVQATFGDHGIKSEDIIATYHDAWYTDADRHFAEKACRAYDDFDYPKFYRCMAALQRLTSGTHFHDSIHPFTTR